MREKGRGSGAQKEAISELLGLKWRNWRDRCARRGITGFVVGAIREEILVNGILGGSREEARTVLAIFRKVLRSEPGVDITDEMKAVRAAVQFARRNARDEREKAGEEDDKERGCEK